LNLRVDAGGWVADAQRIESGHCDERPAGIAIELVVIHGISLPPGAFGGDGVVGLFTGHLSAREHPYYVRLSGVRVSAHFFVRRDGRLLQFVSCLRRAWHAGVSSWRGRDRCNDFSIGIEFEGTDSLPYEIAQYETSAALIDQLAFAYPLLAVAAHSDIAPERKSDPGPCFDWRRLSRLPRG